MHRMSITTRRALAEQDVLTGRNVATAEETVSNRSSDTEVGPALRKCASFAAGN